MRVLVVHNRYRSAQPSGENAVVDLETRLLAEAGCDVHRAEVTSDEIAGWPLRRRATLPVRVVWSREGARLTRAAIDRVRPDLVHFHNTFPLLSPAALRAAGGSRTAVVQTLHNFRPLCPAATFLREGSVCEDCLGRVPLAAVRHGCYRGSRTASASLAAMIAVHRGLATWSTHVDLFLAPSEFTRATYVRAGWPADRIAVKYNTAARPAAKAAAAPHGFSCLARLGPEKGVDVLLRAWKRAFPDGGEPLRIVGAGDSEPELRRLAGAAANVEFLGQLEPEAALEVAAASRAVVIPSRCYEVFPRTVVEAFSLGVPVIASRIGSLGELVESGRSGLLVDPRSEESLAGALAAVAGSDDLQRKLAQGARAAYAARFDPQTTTRALIDLYEGALSRRASVLAAGGRA